ncbi:ferrous iron transport protein B [Enterocloster asparagiformis]|uniref:ferrous iron transport protein B n=1 Tax=Enterocloster asparagiformis TaxID=333367 RepID=UPI002A7F206D|nr:ferrous iron transport protein B [Enterocloster asparagiformis]
MGLTNTSVGMGAVDSGLEIRKQAPTDKVVAIAGNPNVGKSTLFNNLTGMNQHTGNWPGKTVSNAQGWCKTGRHGYVLVDIPGTYSLMAHSAEEEVARNFICFGKSDAVVVVCDATCLERNLNLVLQTMEISDRVLVCVNLLDEAKRKHISIDLNALSDELGVPVAGTVARKKKSLDRMMDQLDDLVDRETALTPFKVQYDPLIEQAIHIAEPAIRAALCGKIPGGEAADAGEAAVGEMAEAAAISPCCDSPAALSPRWLALKLLDYDKSLMDELKSYLGFDILEDPAVAAGVEAARDNLKAGGHRPEQLKDKIVSGLVKAAEAVSRKAVHFQKEGYNDGDRRLDKVLTSKWAGYPIMLALLALVFWITITGANYPSALLSDLLFQVQDRLLGVFHYIGAPEWLTGMLVLGIYRVLAWVVSVMLPPMAIFFPMFTLLEDSGYLPRIAYNLDKPFKCCHACGKQALTMCMGFGCNAAGIVGCRIIDSPRERLIAMVTNNFVPCNGRFPTLIAIISMFFVGVAGGAGNTLLSSLLLTLLILFGILMTFAVSKALSMTVLKGVPSSFTLELPPYRRPQIGKVIVRSIFDRTLFVLGRAIVVAAPAGLLIWIMANVYVGDLSLLAHCSAFLDPFARLMGLDGVILMAFILGLPANEIVIPIIIMAYMAQGSLLEFDSLTQLKELLVANGWTWVTAVCTMLFSLMHWPCSTTLLTIRKETGGWKWVIASFLIPTLCGIALCMLVAGVAGMLA